MKIAALLLSSLALALASGCRPPEPSSSFPRSAGLPLLGHPVHLGNNLASGQNWAHGEASAALHCALVNLPRASNVQVQVVGVRNTETLADQLLVNGQTFALPITLEQDPRGLTPNATQHSPLYAARLEAGPSQICLVAGQRPNGDIDDFEVEEILLFADGTPREQIAVRPGLTRGTPPPTLAPGQPWGARQQPHAWPTLPRPCPVFVPYGFSGC